MVLSTITTRAATAEDRSFLADCFLRAMRESIEAARGGWDEARETKQFDNQLDLAATSIIQADGIDVGFVMCVQEEDALRIHTICLRPEYQGRGIGSCVTVDLVRHSAAGGKDVLLSVLKTNARADALYRRLGFVVVSESEHHRHLKHFPSAGK